VLRTGHRRAHRVRPRIAARRTRGRGGTGLRAGFRCRWANALGGSSPSARTLSSSATSSAACRRSCAQRRGYDLAPTTSSRMATLSRCETTDFAGWAGDLPTELLAVLTEDGSDIGRVVGEEVPHVRVLGHPAAGQLGGEAVARVAAIWMDQPAHQRARMSSGECQLPVRQLDRRCVLAAGPVLRKGPWDRRMRDVKDVGFTDEGRPGSDGSTGEGRAHRGSDLLGDPLVLAIVDGPQAPESGRQVIDASVAKISAQQVAIRPGVGDRPRCVHLGPHHGRRRRSAPSPATDRWLRHAGLARDRTISHGRCEQRADIRVRIGRTDHVRTYVPMPSGRLVPAAGTIASLHRGVI
jgi:hypothetical protein